MGWTPGRDVTPPMAKDMAKDTTKPMATAMAKTTPKAMATAMADGHAHRPPGHGHGQGRPPPPRSHFVQGVYQDPLPWWFSLAAAIVAVGILGTLFWAHQYPDDNPFEKAPQSTTARH